jgi:trigger factor
VTLQIQTEENEQREVLMTVTVAEERIEKEMRQKARELARNMNMPGFRRGKAPYHVVLSRVGADSLRAEVIEKLVPDLFDEALAQSGFGKEQLYTNAMLEDMTAKPLVLKFRLPLLPQVELGDYRALRWEVEPVAVQDEAVAKALESIQGQHQELEVVERAAELGDLVTIGGVGYLLPRAAETTAESEAEAAETAAADKREIIFDQAQANILMDPEKSLPGTSFVDNILGLGSGAEAVFIITFPEDYDDEEMAGREAQFEITVVNVQQRELPPLDDDLAQKEGHETVDALRETARQNLQQQAEEQARTDLLTKVVKEILKEGEVVYPPVAVEQEIDSLTANYKEQLTRSGWKWEDYLVVQGRSEAEVRENFRETAVNNLNSRFVLAELLNQEKISVQAGDLDDMVEQQLARFGDERLRASMRDYFLQGEGANNMASEVLVVKLYERLKAILSGTAPTLDELETTVIALDEEE